MSAVLPPVPFRDGNHHSGAPFSFQTSFETASTEPQSVQVQYEVIKLQEDVPIFPKAVAEFA
jgi:hypothetical protein